jgi:hypothetical protein
LSSCWCYLFRTQPQRLCLLIYPPLFSPSPLLLLLSPQPQRLCPGGRRRLFLQLSELLLLPIQASTGITFLVLSNLWSSASVFAASAPCGKHDKPPLKFHK